MEFAKGILGCVALVSAAAGVAYLASKVIREEDLATFCKKTIDGAGEITKSYLTSEPNKMMVDFIGAASKTVIGVTDYETRH